jgi:hypothetical protein
LKVQYSEWLVKAEKGAQEIFDDLAQHLEPEDRLLIVEVDPARWSGQGAIKGGTEELAAFLRG